MAYFTTIIARILALTDKVLAIWTSTPVEITQGAGTGCQNVVVNVCVNACGTALVGELQNMVFGGVSFANGLLQALGAGCY
jgi:hypothetical protein